MQKHTIFQINLNEITQFSSQLLDDLSNQLGNPFGVKKKNYYIFNTEIQIQAELPTIEIHNLNKLLFLTGQHNYSLLMLKF